MGKEPDEDKIGAPKPSLHGDGDGKAFANAWHEIAKQVVDEKDPVKMRELCRKLDEVILAEGQKKVLQRFEAIRDGRPKPQR